MKNEMQHLAPKELVQLASLLQRMMMILNARLFCAAGLLLSAGGFAWVMYQPDAIRLAGACCFTLLTVWPLYRLESKRTDPQPGGNHAQDQAV